MPATTHGYSMVKFTYIDGALSEFFELEGSPVKGQALQQKDKGKKERHGRHTLHVGHFLVQKCLAILISACA